MSTSASIRVSDAEREHAVALLRSHYAEGRLNAQELEHRARDAYAARRRDELALLLADLPAMRRAGWSPATLMRRLRRTHRMLLRGHLATYLAVNGLLIGTWLVTGKGLFWPALYLVPSTALVAWHWMATRVLARALSGPPAPVPWMLLIGHVFARGRRARG